MLDKLPSGLEETYIQCLESIDANEVYRNIAPKVFKWVLCAEHPLTAREAQIFASMDIDNVRLTSSQVINMDVVDCCANLICLSFSSRTVTFFSQISATFSS